LKVHEAINHAILSGPEGATAQVMNTPACLACAVLLGRVWYARRHIGLPQMGGVLPAEFLFLRG
jgi:hypothetical protein